MDDFVAGIAPQPASAPETVADDTQPGTVIDGNQTDATGATETVEETDEQKNERTLRERQERSERQYKGVQRRIDELTRDKYAERAARERAEREADELRQRVLGNQRQPQEDGPQPPRREDYQDYEAYIDARAEYRAALVFEQRLQEASRQAQQRQSQEQVARSVQQDRAAIAQSADKFRATAKDFDEVMAGLDVPSTPVMERAIARTENPAAVLYALGKKPEVAQQIAALDPVDQAKAIGAIEFALKSRPPQVSKAPAPGNPVGGKPSLPSADPTRMSYDEFVAWRRRNTPSALTSRK